MGEFYISKYGPEWEHALMRIRGAVKAASKKGPYDRQKFVDAMLLRLRKMKSDSNDLNISKVFYTIAVLKYLGATEDGDDETGYQWIVDVYEGRITMEILDKGKKSVYNR